MCDVDTLTLEGKRVGVTFSVNRRWPACVAVRSGRRGVVDRYGRSYAGEQHGIGASGDTVHRTPEELPGGPDLHRALPAS